MFKSTIQVTLFSLLSLIINFGTQLLIAYYFGATQDRDAYFAALTFPTYITNLLLGSIIVLFLPILIQQQSKGDQNSYNIFTSRFINLFSLVLLFIIGLAIIYARPLLHFTLPGFNERQLNTTIPLFRILMLSAFFTNSTNLLAAILQSRLKFSWAAMAPIISACTNCLLIVFWGEKIGITILAVGMLAGSFLGFIALLIVSLKHFTYHLNFNFRHESIVRIVHTALPLLIAGLFFRSTGIFEKMISSNYPVGSISYLGYATIIITIFTTIASNGIATSIFPSLSKKYAENDMHAFKHILEKGIRLILFLTIPISIILAFFSSQLVAFLLERGEFTSEDSKAIGFLIILFVGSLIGNSLGSVVVKVFYILGSTKLNSVLELAGMLLYVIPAFIVGRYFSYQGLAIVSSVSSLLSISISIFFVYKLLNGIRIGYILKVGLTTLFVCLLVYSAAYLIFNAYLNFEGHIPRYFALISILTIATICYFFIMTYFFGIDEFKAICKKIYPLVQ